MSCENAGSSGDSNEILMEKQDSIKDTEEGMYSYVSDDDLEEEY